MDGLNFGDIPVNHSFIHGADMFVKVSATYAVSITYNKKLRFKKSESVCFFRTMRFSSHTQGGCQSSWKKESVKKYIRNLKRSNKNG